MCVDPHRLLNIPYSPSAESSLSFVLLIEFVQFHFDSVAVPFDFCSFHFDAALRVSFAWQSPCTLIVHLDRGWFNPFSWSAIGRACWFGPGSWLSIVCGSFSSLFCFSFLRFRYTHFELECAVHICNPTVPSTTRSAWWRWLRWIEDQQFLTEEKVFLMSSNPWCRGTSLVPVLFKRERFLLTN